jgi:hypothetical protein
MKFRVGYELQYEFPQATPVMMMLNVHYTRVSDLERPDHIVISPSVPISGYRDHYGNWCSRALAPAGAMRISTDTVINDTGLPDPAARDAGQVLVHELPHEALIFLLASRYCDSDRMLDLSWQLFGQTKPGWARVQPSAISCMSASLSATSMRGSRAPLRKPMRTNAAYVATTPIWPSPSAAP